MRGERRDASMPPKTRQDPPPGPDQQSADARREDARTLPRDDPRGAPRTTGSLKTAPRTQPRSPTVQAVGLAPGDILGGQYRVEEKLGEGGMGVVYRARDTTLERDVAVKLIHPEFLSCGGSRERFLVEAQAMARVRHPNVVEVHTYGEHQGAPYFIMEYVRGTTAEEWFRDAMMTGGGPPPVDEALGIFEQCCRGVTAIHASGTIHGDLKPSNVLLGPNFRVAVTDLGLARMVDQSAPDQLAGTPAYMAPEGLAPVEDAGLAMRRDVYSLGVIAYELLTGRLPYEIASHTDFQQLREMAPPEPASALRADLPSMFDACLQRALELDPRRRTESPDALRRDLMTARLRASRNQPGLRLLVADDDPDILAMLHRTLLATFPGAEIASVVDGERALDSIERQPPDLAILDLNMPGANGLEVTAAIRGRTDRPQPPILVITAVGGGRDWQLLRELGADGFLVKPFDPATLTAMVGRMLENRAGRRAS